jgi:predicted aspartyl protease
MPVQVGSVFDRDKPTPLAKAYVGIWDTGATASAITQKIIDECVLKPISMAKVHGAGGEYLTEVYLVSVHFPNKVIFNPLRVTKAKLPAGSDMLIGMDIIGSGDFAVTSHQGRTCFTFRVPSVERIDFTGKAPIPPSASPPSAPPSDIKPSD